MSQDTTDVSTPTFEDFVQIDDDVVTAGEYTDDDIVQNSVSTRTNGNDCENVAEQSHNLDKEAEKIPKKQEALNTLNQTILDKIYELEKIIQNITTETQLKLTNFFN